MAGAENVNAYLNPTLAKFREATAQFPFRLHFSRSVSRSVVSLRQNHQLNENQRKNVNAHQQQISKSQMCFSLCTKGRPVLAVMWKAPRIYVQKDKDYYPFTALIF